ncbi:MAG: DegQ family serine endoprotease [Thermodesulfobacteriota bacterium]
MNVFKETGPSFWGRFIVGLSLAVMAVGLWWSVPALGAEVPGTFADVAAKASPAVVNISTVRVIKGGAMPYPFRGQPGQPRDPFEEFFERFFGEQMPRGDRTERSLGSGVIIDPAGYIVTNNHVVEDADEIVVRLSDEHQFKAEMIGRDPKTDLALIKVKSEVQLPFLALGDSDKARIGDWVVAIGNPFGLDFTVTAGILSAKGRVIGAGPYDDFLQTDASINPGNSGGPLLNLDGEVIGINTAIAGIGTGIGFAIPTNLAKGIIEQLKEKGRVIRGWLGVMIQKVTPELARHFKLKEEKGALVGDVMPGGPADEGGLKRGDVIVKFDGREIKDFSELPALVAATSVGKQVEVVVVRDGMEKTFEVTIGELEEEQAAEEAVPGTATDLGLTVQELTPEMAQSLGLSETEGVVISGIAGGSPAEDSGLRPGDLILEVNRQPIKGLAEYRQIIGEVKKGDTVLFLVKRGSTTLFFTLDAK